MANTAPSTVYNSTTEVAFYDVKDVQQYLRISRSLAYELMRRDDFPKIRIGSTIRVPVSSFHAWVKRQVGEAME